MKKLLLSLFVLCVFNCNAQKNPALTEWQKLNMDSLEFVERFGSVNEFQSENHIMNQSKNGFRVFFIGAKVGYVNYFLLYLMQKHMKISTTETTNSLSFKAKGYDNEKGYDTELTGTFSFGKNQRVTGARITGTPQTLIDLFINYWENFDLNYNELKSKKTVFTMNASDKVNFSWTGAKPVITITKGIISFEFDKNN